jgi:hypothetical protein
MSDPNADVHGSGPLPLHRRFLAWMTSPGKGGWPGAAGAFGVLYLFALTALSTSGPLVSDREPVLGTAAHAVAELVRLRYASEIARITVILAAATIATGAMMGMLAGALLWLRARVAGAPALPRWKAAVLLGLVVVFEHGAFVAWSMTLNPQVFADRFYAAFGLPRALQLFATASFSPTGVIVSGAVAAAAFVLGKPSGWGRILRGWARWARRRPAVFGFLVVAAVASIAWLLVPYPSPKSSKHNALPNVLILASDSLRADRLRPSVAPHLSALAAESTTFERAYVTVPRTFPSWVTILTGRHAHHHGVRMDMPRWEERAKDFDALPQRFSRAGYRTSVISDFAGDIFDRIQLGFSTCDAPHIDFRKMLQQRGIKRDLALFPFADTPLGRAALPVVGSLETATDPSGIAERAMAEMRRAEGRPFFLTVFFSTTHFPYAAPFPYYKKFTDPAYRGPFKYAKEVGLADDTVITDDDVRQVRALYDGSVASVDDAAGRILDEVKRDGLADSTIIVVTSDHGEGLFETTLAQGHGDNLFGDEGTHVPLSIFDPRRPLAHREKAVVSSVDIAPTLYELAGVPAPPDLDGRSLAPAVGGAPLASRPVFAETELWMSDRPHVPDALRIAYPHLADLLEIDQAHDDMAVVRAEVEEITLVARHRMVKDERWKLIYMPTRLGVRYLLFDTERDPAEFHDVFAKEPEEAARMSGVLWQWMLQDPRMTKERGYLVPKPRSPHVDPVKEGSPP